ncbi:hypothetical protein D9613_003319 [Agrocybe pediades]|uniref:Uncharacterized protein n=1 Tax=Agrocybe pediades TaxID=84607 RepID=A0A8H4QNZ2_9AGAR|nr:hypothetical protein D9613_003319 [Agrocybe pediades]
MVSPTSPSNDHLNMVQHAFEVHISILSQRKDALLAAGPLVNVLTEILDADETHTTESSMDSSLKFTMVLVLPLEHDRGCNGVVAVHIWFLVLLPFTKWVNCRPYPFHKPPNFLGSTCSSS